MAVIHTHFKSALLQGGYSLGLFKLLRHRACHQVNILMYHRFSEKPESFKLDRDSFGKQLRFFRQNYNVIRLSDYAAAMEGRKTLPPNSLVLTVDDGYWDNYTVAFPLLRKYDLPATIFLATDFIDKGAWLWPLKLLYILQNTPHKAFSFSLDGQARQFRVDSFERWHRTQLAIFHYLRTIADPEKEGFLDSLAKDLEVAVPDRSSGDFTPLTWDQIREMQQHDIEFGSHTCSHPILSRLTKDAIAHETRESKKLIESELQAPVRSFCYPNGQPEDFSTDVIESLQKSGYQCAVTTIHGANPMANDRPFELKRKSLLFSRIPKLYRELVRS